MLLTPQALRDRVLAALPATVAALSARTGESCGDVLTVLTDCLYEGLVQHDHALQRWERVPLATQLARHDASLRNAERFHRRPDAKRWRVIREHRRGSRWEPLRQRPQHRRVAAWPRHVGDARF